MNDSAEASESVDRVAHLRASDTVSAKGLRWIALLGICAANLQGGVVKLTSYGGAIGEMQHFGVPLPEVSAALVIVLALGAPSLGKDCALQRNPCRWPASGRASSYHQGSAGYRCHGTTQLTLSDRHARSFS